ncbi:MAG: hypothetical protein HYV36_05575 [Lentisphaerae bacterium]|nr:hypothetical protein [Lentisphaerota bacterium]
MDSDQGKRINAKPKRQTQVKVIGRRQPQAVSSPAEYHRRALALQQRVNRLNPFPKPRGFVFKAESWDAYEAWKQRQSNPRLW